MDVTLICFGLLAAGLGIFLRWWLTRKWMVLQVDPNNVRIPKLCPSCLSCQADAVVEEDSASRQTAYYVIAYKLEWQRASVFYCQRCARKLARFTGVAILLGTMCAGIAFLILLHFHALADEPLALAFTSLMFGVPAYYTLTTFPKGIVFGKAYPKSMQVRIRHAQYGRAMESLQDSNSTTPLGDNGGVWVR